ncbi:MAG TPA: penicillin acylase family protein, partial [Candidatus Cybelea sp.]|nr:penicillin acylase family protein [Candidatus Cybelea sp.]
LAVSLALGDSWRDVLARNDVWQRYGAKEFDARFPLSDDRYDVSLSGNVQKMGVAPRQARGDTGRDNVASVALAKPRAGSNAWAAGAAHTVSGRALLANDPHLDLTIPGLWYVLDLRAPGVHVAGASIPGAPGILLGHNERIAWGATNGDAATMSLFDAGRLHSKNWVREVFHVRFAADATRAYYRTAREFGVPDTYRGDRMVLVRWPQFAGDAPAASSSIATFLSLDRASSVRGAFAILARYDGPAENFVVADTHGEVAYHLAGSILSDDAWGRYVHPSDAVRGSFAAIPFARLPSIRPSQSGLVVSANNKMYPAAYPYRLAPYFDLPYRAYRIAELLRSRAYYDPAYFESMQLDTISPIDREFARRIATYAQRSQDPAVREVGVELAAWDGGFTPDSRAATLEHAMRATLEANEASFSRVLSELRDGRPSPNLEADVNGLLYYANEPSKPWGAVGSVQVEHPLSSLRFGFLNGALLPGEGDEYTIHLQEPGFSQSFRAVWDVGNWDGGGIAIPSGESGQPGSGHYTDLSHAWITGRLDALPFSEPAVQAATRARQELEP